MKSIHALKAELTTLFGEQYFAVLATRSGERIHTTLVAFAAVDDLKTVFVCTPRATRKYDNIKENQGVSLLVHNSTNQTTDIRQAKAVTISGTAAEVAADQLEQARGIYLARQPQMADFANSPDTAMIEIRVDQYDVVAHFQEVTILEIHKERINILK